MLFDDITCSESEFQRVETADEKARECINYERLLEDRIMSLTYASSLAGPTQIKDTNTLETLLANIRDHLTISG